MGLALGASLLGMTARPASAQIDPSNNPLTPGSSWQGFAWDTKSAANGGAGLALWSVQNSSFMGGLSLFGRGRVVSGRCNFGDGSVDIGETNSTAPIMLKGFIVPTKQGGYIATLGVTQLSRSLGTVKLLWLRKGSSMAGLIPPDPYLSANVPYSGRFQADSGDIHGLIGLLFDPQRPAGDNATPPSFLAGAMNMQDFHFRFVASIDPERKAGGYGFDLLGQSTVALLPAVRVGGTYLTDAMTGKPIGFQGSYLLFNSMFSPFSGGSFSAFAP